MSGRSHRPPTIEHMEDVDSATVETAPYACASCRKYKRRCDKTVPSCSLCLKTGKICDFSNSPPATHADEISNLRSRVRELEDCVLSSSTPAARAPSGPDLSHHQYPSSDVPLVPLHVQVSYLDSNIWSLCNPPVYINNELATEEILVILGSRSDIDAIKTSYFQSVHTWMPIISKTRLDRLIDQTYYTIKADVALLLLCMKLVQAVPPVQQPGPSDLYVTAKQYINDLQIRGLFTLRIVQAGLLLSVYELGHAIMPAAFTTIGQCARIGIALGLHNKLAPQLTGKPRSWADWEERQRVWWMIVILDRYITVGVDYRPLCTEDPNKDSLLPVNDSAWNSGEVVPPERVSLSAQRSSVSPFARLAQAANLLGRVIRHCNETSLELQFLLDDFETLSQAIFSLIELLSGEGTTEACTAITLCFSALFKLYRHHACALFDKEIQHLEADTDPRVRQCMQHCLDMVKEICQRVVAFLQDRRHRLTHAAMETVSPLMLHCIYSCAASLSWLSLETNDTQYTTGKHICEDMLQSLSLRWKAADIYLKMLRMSDSADRESG
ncbi:fungal-specific transcription factor domain protein [Ilyonectria destructans]|nr:fungal-specific transcription factor domain protein [Ilyonectria destructans]